METLYSSPPAEEFGPRKKMRLSDDDEHSSTYSPGAIRSIIVRNFITFAYAEFHMGPALNLVIGPNGTGKSTLVSAICLGLGGKPELIGRQKYLGEFVKNGESSGSIKIELENTPGSAPVIIERIITVSNNSSDWKLNKRAVKFSEIKPLLQKLDVQVDNLCQFLPQDKVVEFAQMKPEKLLRETERAVGSSKLLEYHDNLIDYDKELEGLKNNLDTAEDALHELRELQKASEERVAQHAQSILMKKKVFILEKVLQYALVNDFRSTYNEQKELFTRSKAVIDTLTARLSVVTEAEKKAEGAYSKAQEIQKKFLNRITKTKQKITTYSERVQKIDQEIAGLQGKTKAIYSAKEKRAALLSKAKDDLQRLMGQKFVFTEEDEAQLAELTPKLHEISRKDQEIQTEISNLSDDARSAEQHMRRLKQTIESRDKELEKDDRLDVLHNLKGKLAENVLNAIPVVRQKRKDWENKIYDPPVLSVSLKSSSYAAAVEAVISLTSFMTFTTCDRDFYLQVCQEIIDNRHLNIPIKDYSNSKQSKLEDMKPSLPTAELKNLGFDGYVLDFVDGPKPVLHMLCVENRIHTIPIALRELSSRQLDEVVKLKDQNGSPLFPRLISGSTMYTVKKSRYGSKEVFIQTEDLRPPKILASAASSTNKERLRSKVAELKRELKESNQKYEKLLQDISALRDSQSSIGSEKALVQDQRKELNDRKSMKHRWAENVRKKKAQVKHLEEELVSDKEEEIRKAEEEISQKLVLRTENVLKYAHEVELLYPLTMKLSVCNFDVIGAHSDFQSIKQYKALFEESQQSHIVENQKLKRNLIELKHELKKMVVECKNMRESLEAEDKEELERLINHYSENGELTETYIEHELRKLRSDLELNGNSSEDDIILFEQRAREIETLEERKSELDNELMQLQRKIATVRSQWEPELESLVETISNRFSESFAAVGSAGEVRLVRNELFRDWRLEILVKFRDAAELRILDSNFQSGGERAVSTVFFVIALQGLSQAPFRVIDEINQGMDPKNERIVHKHLIETACMKDTSQYFLITPKLLQDLHYHPRMEVICIFAGLYLPDAVENQKLAKCVDFTNYFPIDQDIDSD